MIGGRDMRISTAVKVITSSKRIVSRLQRLFVRGTTTNLGRTIKLY